MKHKNKRQTAILDIISANDIETQDELAYRLQMIGITATQATISRDIKQLHLVKVMVRETNKYRYEQRLSASYKTLTSSAKTYSLLKESIVSVNLAQNIVVVRCYVGMAQAACAALDAEQHEYVIGTIAGDDTIFIATENNEKAAVLAKKLKASVAD